MQPRQAQQKVLELFNAAAAIVGTDHWDLDRANGWLDCTVRGEPVHAQVSFAGKRKAPLPAAPHTIAVEVQKAWARLGVRIDTFATDKEISPPGQLILSSPAYLSGSNPDGSTYYFAVTDDYAVFDSDGPCVAGDSGTLNEQWNSTATPSPASAP